MGRVSIKASQNIKKISSRVRGQYSIHETGWTGGRYSAHGSQPGGGGKTKANAVVATPCGLVRFPL